MRKFRSTSFRSIRSRYSRGYNAPGSYTSSYGSDDGYDAAKDAYLMGYGPAVTDSQRREEEMLREEDRRYRYEMGR